MLLPWGGVSVKTTLIGFSFVAISLLAASSHIRAMLTDPGAVPIEFTPGNLFHEQVSARPPAPMTPMTRRRGSSRRVGSPAGIATHVLALQRLQAGARTPLLTV